VRLSARPNAIAASTSFMSMSKWSFLLTAASTLYAEAVKRDAYHPESKLDVSRLHGSLPDRTSSAKRNIKRLAILRPFSRLDVKALSHSFDEWDAFLPCDISKRIEYTVDPPVLVDVFLSYSQTFESYKPAIDHVRSIIDGFAANYNASGWEQCIRSIKRIECDIDPQMDIYAVHEAHTNRMWVHGPNQQFVKSMDMILGGEFGHYDAVFVMESDVSPVRQYWLDSLLEDAERDPFMILGSKYLGDSWNEFRSSLPLSLQHHMNGNAVYNATHPFLKELLNQLQLEEDTPYHAVPYDYRISQILVEGMLGILPEIPPDIVDNWSKSKGLELERNTKKFRALWDTYGNKNGKTGSTIVRESQVIANYAGTNLLPQHRESIGASLVHGGAHYESWDSLKCEITLVITEWCDGLASNLLSQIDASSHPFSKVILMIPHSMAQHDINALSSIQTKIDVYIKKRDSDFMDMCNAPVNTEYFMMTNSYHIVSQQVDLLFTNDSRRLPVIPFTRADISYCQDSQTCVKAYEESKQFDKQSKIIVQDFDMLFRTDLRDKFCSIWRERYGHESVPVGDLGIQDSLGPMGPTATTYTSFLSMRGILGDFYAFTDQGKKNTFKRIISVEEEEDGAYGETVLSNHILKEEATIGDIMNHVETYQLKSERYLGLSPSFTPPMVNLSTKSKQKQGKTVKKKKSAKQKTSKTLKGIKSVSKSEKKSKSKN